MGELRYFARRALLLFVLAVIGLPAAAQDAARASTPMNRRLLDLRAPPLNHVLSAAQIEAFTAASDDAPLESVIVTHDSGLLRPFHRGAVGTHAPAPLLANLHASRRHLPRNVVYG